MKKLLILFLLLFCISLSYSSDIKVKVLIKSVDIISPDGEKRTYGDVSKIPPIEYASKIIATGMVVLDYYSIDILLKSQQGLFIAKNPITRNLEFSKVENTRKGDLTVVFSKDIVANISPDGKFSLKYDPKQDCIFMEIIDGHAIMNINEVNFELLAGDTFRHELRGKKSAIQVL